MRGHRRDGRREQGQLRVLRRNGLRIHDARQRFPESRRAAPLAIAEDGFVGGADVGFKAGVVDLFESLAGAADEGEKAELLFQGADGREIDFPEIQVGIEEGHAIGVLAGLFADVADDTDFRFFVFFGPAKDELLLWGKLVAGKNAGAVKTEEDGGGVLGEDAAVQIAADKEDGNFLRDASAAAHNLLWQAGCQRLEG